MPTLPFVLHLAAVSATSALMALVATLSYPLFAYVTPAAFRAYHAEHCRRITLPVGVLLALELGSGAALCASRPSYWSWSWGYMALTGLGIGVTAVWAVPLHTALGQGYQAPLLARLRRVHAVRTGIWALHLGAMLVQLFVARSMP